MYPSHNRNRNRADAAWEYQPICVSHTCNRLHTKCVWDTYYLSSASLAPASHKKTHMTHPNKRRKNDTKKIVTNGSVACNSIATQYTNKYGSFFCLRSLFFNFIARAADKKLLLLGFMRYSQCKTAEGEIAQPFVSRLNCFSHFVVVVVSRLHFEYACFNL